MIRDFFLLLLAAGAALAAEYHIALPDPSRPATVQAKVVNGPINVAGHNAKDVIVEARDPIGWDPEGDNGIRIRGPRNGGIQLRVPYSTSLKLESGNTGGVHVDRVTGEMELASVNGGVYATNISGSVVANSTNGRIVIEFDRITPGKQMSFSTLNGDVDVTLPADTRANLQMRSDNGSINCDFEMRLAPGTYGRGRVTAASINGGGAEMTFRSVNGSIRIRRRR